MALDTRNRRASMMCLGLPFGRLLPTGISDLTAIEDQRHMIGLSGLYNTASLPATPDTWRFVSYVTRTIRFTSPVLRTARSVSPVNRTIRGVYNR